MDPSFYFEQLYPLQDRVLRSFAAAETGFYLSRGTGASRGYLQHRFSDDLDLFVNDDPSFALWSQRLIDSQNQTAEFRVDVLVREERFVRFETGTAEIRLKVELVNDVPAHVGEIRMHPVLGRLDSGICERRWSMGRAGRRALRCPELRLRRQALLGARPHALRT